MGVRLLCAHGWAEQIQLLLWLEIFDKAGSSEVVKMLPARREKTARSFFDIIM